MDANSLSYGIAAVAFGLLALWLFARRSPLVSGRPLAMACTLSTFWAAAYLFAPKGFPYGIVELLRNAGWYYFLLALLGNHGGGQRRG